MLSMDLSLTLQASSAPPERSRLCSANHDSPFWCGRPRENRPAAGSAAGDYFRELVQLGRDPVAGSFLVATGFPAHLLAHMLALLRTLLLQQSRCSLPNGLSMRTFPVLDTSKPATGSRSKSKNAAAVASGITACLGCCPCPLQVIQAASQLQDSRSPHLFATPPRSCCQESHVCLPAAARSLLAAQTSGLASLLDTPGCTFAVGWDHISHPPAPHHP